MNPTAVYRIEKEKLIKLLNQHSDKVSRRRETYRKVQVGNQPLSPAQVLAISVPNVEHLYPPVDLRPDQPPPSWGREGGTPGGTG